MLTQQKNPKASALGFVCFRLMLEYEPLRLALVKRQKQQPQQVRRGHLTVFHSGLACQHMLAPSSDQLTLPHERARVKLEGSPKNRALAMPGEGRGAAALFEPAPACTLAVLPLEPRGPFAYYSAATAAGVTPCAHVAATQFATTASFGTSHRRHRMIDYEVQRCTRHCAVTGRELAAGRDVLLDARRPREPQVVRHDYSRRSLAGSARGRAGLVEVAHARARRAGSCTGPPTT